MGKTDRRNPVRCESSESTTTVFEFDERFPDDAACLNELVSMLYPDGINCPTCGKVTKHHRMKARPAYTCQFCGHMEYPMAGTIFEGSSTSLKLWFYGMYLMTSTRGGISAKRLERELGVSYPTAWRMFNKIRSLMEQDDLALDGTVEMDESYFGGKDKWKHESKKPRIGRGPVSKTTVLGMAQRGRNGRTGTVVAKVADGSGAKELLPHAKAKILPDSTVYTDEFRAYDSLGAKRYFHDRVNHTQKVYVSGDVRTNTIEGFWATVKRGIGGTYHAVSTKHLQSYLDEYAWRYNNRDADSGMFTALLRLIAKRPKAA
jgi:transposase